MQGISRAGPRSAGRIKGGKKHTGRAGFEKLKILRAGPGFQNRKMPRAGPGWVCKSKNLTSRAGPGGRHLKISRAGQDRAEARGLGISLVR